MDSLESLLRHVSSLAARGAPESVINATIRANGFERDQFESAIRSRIEAQNFRPDASVVDRVIGTVREFLGGRTYEMADNMEAVLRMFSDAPPGLPGMAADFASSGLSRDTEGSALLRSRDYETELGNIQAERDVMQQVLPGQSTLANVAGATLAGAREGAAISKALPGLTPQKGQMLGNAARRVGEVGVMAPPAAAAYSLGQYDPRLDIDPTQSLGGDPSNTIQRNMARDTMFGMGIAPTAGPALEAIARGTSTANFVNPQRVDDFRSQLLNAPAANTTGGAGDYQTFPARPEDNMLQSNPYAANRGAQAATAPAGGGAGQPPPRVPQYPMRSEYDPYYNGLIKLGNAISSDKMTVDQVRREATRQAEATGDDLGQVIDAGGINVQRFGRALYNAPGQGAQVAQQSLEGRQLDQGPRMERALETAQTAGIEPETFARESARRRREEINPRFQQLMDMQLPADRYPELRQLLDAGPNMRKAYEAKRIEERDLRGNPDPGDFEGDMTLRTVETARKAISDREGKALRKKAFDSAQALGEYRRRLMAAADEATPNMSGSGSSVYGDVRRQGFDTRRLEEVAADAKRDFYKARPTIMREDFGKLTPVEKDAYRAGFVAEMKAYLSPRMSDSATKANIARSIDKRSLKERIEILFETPQQFQKYWDSVMVEAQRSKSYISTIGDATKNTQAAQSMAADNLIDPSPLDEITQGFAPMQMLKRLDNVRQTREINKISDAIGERFFTPGLDNTRGLLDDVEAAQEMRKYFNQERALRTGALRGIQRGLLE